MRTRPEVGNLAHYSAGVHPSAVAFRRHRIHHTEPDFTSPTAYAEMTRVLLIAPYLNPDATGEAWSTWKWTEGIAQRFDTTVLTTQYPQQPTPSSLFPTARVMAMDGHIHRSRYARWSFSAKPDYPKFYAFARRSLAALTRSGARWDIAHHLSPIALRYPSPLAKAGIPYVLGPLAGSVGNPPGFVRELRKAEPTYMRLRESDRVRFKYDPLLRATLLNCSAFIAVAPYVFDTLPYDIPGHTYLESETGLRDGTALESPDVVRDETTTNLLYVGRITRSKGCRDLVRSLPEAIQSLGSTHLHIIGEGPDRSECEREAALLRVMDHVTFHGRQPHDAVMQHYRRANAFVFPSFREPSGNVVFEAMSCRLPLVVSSTGGPGHAVTGDCGVKVDPVTPQQYSADISTAINSLFSDRARMQRCGTSALSRVRELGHWPDKLARLSQIYTDVLHL